MARTSSREMRLRNEAGPVGGHRFLKWAGVEVVLVVALALAYLRVESRCEQLGGDIQKLEKRSEELDKRLQNEECKWVRMRSPDGLEQALKRHRLVMTWPRQDQIVTLREVELVADRRDSQTTELSFVSHKRDLVND